jgi:choline dehydrogenase
MVNLRTFEVPTVMKHGLGAVKTLADQVKALGLKRPLIVTDPGIVRAGLLERAAAPLKAAHLDYLLFHCPGGRRRRLLPA